MDELLDQDTPEEGFIEPSLKVDDPRMVQRGRGAVSNPTGRFESLTVEFNPNPDWGWLAEDEAHGPVKTQYFVDHSQTIISTNDSPDVGFSASVNPYRGCEHGCIYCYARPTHEYLGLSGGLDFETKIFVKTQAPELLSQALMHPKWEPQCIAMSGVTDCYQPLERHLKLTRRCLEVLSAFKNPVGIVTKNQGVVRDLDILSGMAAWGGVHVFVSLTTLDTELAQVMEPRTASPKRRLATIEALHQAGVPVSVMMGPIIPGLTDHEIPAVLSAAAKAGARGAYYTLLRLPYGNKDLFESWLSHHYPLKKEKVLNHVRQTRDGALNQSDFQTRMRGCGTSAEVIADLFAVAKKRAGLNRSMPTLNSQAFERPASEAHPKQLTIFQSKA